MRVVVLLAALALFLRPSLQAEAPRVVVDHHQHLWSPAAIRLSQGLATHDAAALIAQLDAAGIRRAIVLSLAYQFGNPNRPPVENEYAKVREENDWTSRQVARFPDRLRGFCGVNPLKEYALDEIARCANDPWLHFGLKLHFGNSDVDLDDPAHVQQLRRVFRAANDAHMAIATHLHASVTKRRPYGAAQARIFLNEVLPEAPDVSVQIAHLAGAGGYDDPATDEALAVFAEAIARHDRRMAHVYVDVSGVAGYGKWTDRADVIAKRIREIGVERILYGSDTASSGGMTPREAWEKFLQLPLSEAEFRTIANNAARYMR